MSARTSERPRTEAATSTAWAWRLALIAVGIIAVRFYARYPLHYLIDQTPASYAGYWAHRWWLRIHVAGATIALATGPFQLWTGFRRRHLKLHRTLGFVYLGAAVIGGIGAFGLAIWSAAADHGVSVFVFALAWWITLGMAYRAILARQIAEHQAWMVRGYVLTYGFVSIRALSEFPVWAPLGAIAEPTQNWLGWVVPLLVADVALRWRHAGARTRSL